MGLARTAEQAVACEQQVVLEHCNYLNPEVDYLEIETGPPYHAIFVTFLHDLKVVYDPRHVGLLNLAVAHRTMHNWNLSRHEPADVDSKSMRGFTGTLVQLREVFIVFTPSLLGKWEVAAPQIRYRYMFAFEPLRRIGQVRGLENVKSVLDEEEERWKLEGNPSYIPAAVDSTVCFWLFPLEAVTLVMKECGGLEAPGPILDATGYWPELALMNIT
ncbi:hypothetical protein GQ53DRAFT_880387 [Thozetella sp. PMI_491]|nr:hypothetical protein GQ53DRAFT_880387 [Thozetella sp. PMI_491]